MGPGWSSVACQEGLPGGLKLRHEYKGGSEAEVWRQIVAGRNSLWRFQLWKFAASGLPGLDGSPFLSPNHSLLWRMLLTIARSAEVYQWHSVPLLQALTCTQPRSANHHTLRPWLPVRRWGMRGKKSSVFLKLNWVHSHLCPRQSQSRHKEAVVKRKRHFARHSTWGQTREEMAHAQKTELPKVSGEVQNNTEVEGHLRTTDQLWWPFFLIVYPFEIIIPSTFQFPAVWSLRACGQHAVQLLPGRGFSICKTAEFMAQDSLQPLRRELKVLALFS